MTMGSKISLRGDVKVKLNGKVIREGRNLIVNDGLELCATIFAGTGDIPSHMAVGDDPATPTADDSALIGTEIARVSVSRTVLTNAITLSAVFTGENVSDEQVAEFGIFNNASAGEMFCRFIVSEFTWAVDDLLEVDWTITFGETT